MNALLTAITLQPAPTTSTTGTAPAAGRGPGGCDPGTLNIGMLVAMMLVFYFLLIRPQQKRQREMDTMLKALRKGDIVRTNGGIRGEVTAVDDVDVTLLIAERTRIRVLRSAIASKESSGEPSAENK